MISPESWFVRELKLVDRNLYPFYFARYGKWMIVKDFPRRVLGFTDYDPVSGKNFIVEMVVEDENHKPLPLDGRAMKAVLMAIRRKNNRRYLYECDEAEERRSEKAAEERRLRVKDARRDIHRLRTSKTFILGGLT